MEVVVPTIGRPSLATLLDALAAEPGTVRRVVLVDDRRERPRPLLGDAVPEALRGRVDVLPGAGRGPAAARNVGWRATRAPWVVFLDDDVVPQPGWLADLAADLAAAEVSGAGAVQGCIRVPPPAGRRPTDWERNVGRLDGARWITADLAVRREGLVAVGGFDERFPRAYREDADLSLRLTAAHYHLVEGRRITTHPVGSAPWWISVRQQAGNADDVLMARLHGRGWQGADRGRGRRPRHLAVTTAGLLALTGLAAGRRRLAVAGLVAWMAGTAELTWVRVAAGPRTPREVGAMVATSAAIPAAATYHWLRGILRAPGVTGSVPPPPAGPELDGGDPAYAHTAGTTTTSSPAHPDLDRPPLPRSLQVEVTASCNLRCPMCLVRYRPPVGRAAGAMPLDRFRRLLDDLPTLEDVTLQGLGEPLLAPDVVEMVRLARARGATVGFNTNATVLTEERARALVAAGLSWLAISLDGATPATYEAIRDGARFERVIANVERLVAAGRAAPDGRGPALRFVFVAMRRNVHELPALVRLAARLGVPAVSVQNLSHSFDDVAEESGYQEIARYTEGEALWGPGDRARAADAFREAATEAERLGIDLHLPAVDVPVQVRPSRGRPGSRSGCDWPSRAAYVNHDGVVQPCCMVMGSDRATMGHVDGEGFAAVWWGDRMRSFRAALRTDTPPEVCRGCSLYRGVF